MLYKRNATRAQFVQLEVERYRYLSDNKCSWQVELKARVRGSRRTGDITFRQSQYILYLQLS
jgi:hypothetical protein